MILKLRTLTIGSDFPMAVSMYSLALSGESSSLSSENYTNTKYMNTMCK